jgi:GntR family transcriptional repressor for pyruvate dehydrogenase complex
MSTSRIEHVWKPEKRETTASKVERQIKAAVLNGVFQAGEFLGSENELAARFNVSRLPIREAIGRLGSLGVVEVKTGAGGGVRVAEGDPNPAVEALAIQLALVGTDAKEVLSAWECVQTAVLAKSAENATEQDFAAIEAAIANAASLSNTQEEFAAAAMACNQAEVDAAHNHVLSVSMAAILFSLAPKVSKTTTPEVAQIVLNHHKKMLTALKKRDGAAAQKLFSLHMKLVWSRYFFDLASLR